jgi:hypothetical protein
VAVSVREDLDFFLTKVKLVSYVYRANIVLTFSFSEKIWLLPLLLCRFHSIVPRKNLSVLVSTFSFSEKNWLPAFLLSRFHSVVPIKNLFVLVFTFSFPEKNWLLSFLLSILCSRSQKKFALLPFLLSHFYIIVPRKNLFVLIFTFSFRKKISLFLFPEKFILSSVTRNSRPIYSSTMGDEACVIFLSFSGC